VGFETTDSRQEAAVIRLFRSTDGSAGAIERPNLSDGPHSFKCTVRNALCAPTSPKYKHIAAQWLISVRSVTSVPTSPKYSATSIGAFALCQQNPLLSVDNSTYLMIVFDLPRCCRPIQSDSCLLVSLHQQEFVLVARPNCRSEVELFLVAGYHI
jgi:hypothetical protein